MRAESSEHGMQIAVIGWGSLISSPGILRLRSRWHRDGPSLPVEFARISGGNRLTLVIDLSSHTQQTLWASSASDELPQVRENLREREGTRLSLIHTASADGRFSEGIAESVKESVSAWLRQNPHLSGCVWTGLTSNWGRERNCIYSPADAVGYLRGLDDAAPAREYVQTTPSQIQTETRALIRAQLGWQDAELPDILFENV
jgi:hypothetical protein